MYRTCCSRLTNCSFKIIHSSSSSSSLSPCYNVQKEYMSTKVHLLSPTARNLIAHYGLDGVNIEPTGPRDTLLKSDVLDYINKNKIQPKSLSIGRASSPVSGLSKSQPTSSPRSRTSKKGPKYIDIELSNMRKVIAKRLLESKSTIPHSYMTCTSDITEMVKYREQMKTRGVKFSLNDIVIKATAIALRKTPQVNIKWESSSSNKLVPVNSIDISIAVSTPTGLITPIITSANTLSIEEIGKRVVLLSEKAKSGKLQPHEFQGGSFSISNLGMFGIKEFSAIINPPQVAILAVGRASLQLGESNEKRHIMHSTLSYDSRAMDEESVALFLEVLSEHLASPEQLQKAGDGSKLRRLSSMSL